MGFELLSGSVAALLRLAVCTKVKKLADSGPGLGDQLEQQPAGPSSPPGRGASVTVPLGRRQLTRSKSGAGGPFRGGGLQVTQ